MGRIQQVRGDRPYLKGLQPFLWGGSRDTLLKIGVIGIRSSQNYWAQNFYSACVCVCVCMYVYIYIYRVFQEECARLRVGVPYVKVYRYNPKHLCPKLNGYGDNGQRSLKL
jgi:hypothetical protein